MTISTSSSKMTFTNALGGSSYAYTNHRVPVAADMELYFVEDDEDPVQLTLDTHYSISGAGDDAGVTITYPEAGSPAPYDVNLPSSGYSLVAKLAPAYEQTLDLENQGTFTDSDVEYALDDLSLQLKSLEEIASRCFKVPIGSSSDPDSVDATELENREVLLDEQIASASATIELFSTASTNWPNRYDRLRIELLAIEPSTTSVHLEMWPMDNGVKTVTASSNLPTQMHGSHGSGTAFASNTSGHQISYATADIDNHLSGLIEVSRNGTLRYGYTAECVYDTSSNATIVNSSGMLIADATQLDGFHFAMSTGNITSGTFRLWGLPKT